MTNYAGNQQHVHGSGEHYLTKVSCEISASSLKDFWRKGEKAHTSNLEVDPLI